jgi:hypothetical protein
MIILDISSRYDFFKGARAPVTARITVLPLVFSCILVVNALGQAALPLPTGNTGIASKYTNDANITSDPNVIFFDDFESYSSSSVLWNNWSNLYQQQYLRMATESANVFAGKQSLEMKVPPSTTEIANAVEKSLSTGRDLVFVRVYTRFATNYNISGSEHNGIAITANYCCPGVPANGTNKFYVDVENGRDLASANPGFTNAYVYHPEQRDAFGDHWFPDGVVLPFSSTPGNFGPDFISRANFIPEVGRWYSYEIMVKANTPGQRDGRVAIWIDGKLIADFLNLRLRDVSTLKINKVELDLFIKNNNTTADMLKWYDNVVIASSYIGPMSRISPPTNLTATVQ